MCNEIKEVVIGNRYIRTGEIYKADEIITLLNKNVIVLAKCNSYTKYRFHKDETVYTITTEVVNKDYEKVRSIYKCKIYELKPSHSSLKSCYIDNMCFTLATSYKLESLITNDRFLIVSNIDNEIEMIYYNDFAILFLTGYKIKTKENSVMVEITKIGTV